MSGAPTRKVRDQEAREKSVMEKAASRDKDSGRAAAQAASEEALNNDGKVGRGKGARGCAHCGEKGHRATHRGVVTCPKLRAAEAEP